MRQQDNIQRVSDGSAQKLVLKPSHKPSVPDWVVEAVLTGLSKTDLFPRSCTDCVADGVLPIQISMTGKKGAQLEVSFSTNRISVVIPQRFKEGARVSLAVEERFLTLAIKEELVSLGTRFILEGALPDESTALVGAMADRYQELKGDSTHSHRKVWREVVDIHRSELQTWLKKMGKKSLVFNPLGDAERTYEEVNKMLGGVAKERAVSLLLGSSGDQGAYLMNFLNALDDQFAGALWRKHHAQAADCRAAAHLLEAGFEKGAFEKPLPFAISPEVKRESLERALQEGSMLPPSIYSESTARSSTVGIDGVLIASQLKATARAFSQIVKFETSVRENCLGAVDIMEETMEILLEATSRFTEALLGNEPEDAQVVSDVMGQLLALRFSGQEVAEEYFTFILSGMSPEDFNRGNIDCHSGLAASYVQFLSVAAAFKEGGLSPASAMSEQQGFMPAIAVRTFRVLIHAYESALASMLDSSKGVSAERMEFLSHDIESLERGVEAVLPFLRSQEMKRGCEAMLKSAIEGLRNAMRQLHLLTLSGDQLIKEVHDDKDVSNHSLLTERLMHVRQALQNRINNYAQNVSDVAENEIAQIRDGDSIVPLVDYIVNLLSVVRVSPDAERDAQLFETLNDALLEMVALIREGYGSEIDLVSALSDSTQIERYGEYVLRGLEALSSMHTEFSYVRAHLRGIDDRLNPIIFNKVDIFLDQVPKHFGLALKKHPEVIEHVLDILAQGGEASLPLSDTQRVACIKGLGALRGFKSGLSRMARAQLEQLLSNPR